MEGDLRSQSISDEVDFRSQIFSDEDDLWSEILSVEEDFRSKSINLKLILKNKEENYELRLETKMKNLEYMASEILSRVPAATDESPEVGLLFAFHGGYKGINLCYVEHGIVNINDQQYSNHTRIKNHPRFANRFDNDIMIGSCNGLVCFSILHYGVQDPICISNPLTEEYVYLPPLVKPDRLIGRNPFHKEYYVYLPISLNSKDRLVCGFGYHASTNEYKVVRIYYPDQESFGRVEVYTLGNAQHQWRNKGEIPYSLHVSSGALVNGALHWLDYNDWKILAFDLADEEFRVLPSPPCFHYDKLTTFYQLIVLGGCLSVVHHELGERVDIWSLKKNSGDEVNEQDCDSWSWRKEYSIAGECLDEDGYYEPFALTKSNEVLFWYNGMILFCYDPKTQTLKKLMDDEHMRTNYFQAIPHINSSVSLEALGEMPVRSKKNQSKFKDDWILV